MVKKVRDAVAPGSSGLSFLSESEKVVGWVESQSWAVNTKKAAYIAFKSVLRDAGDPSLKAAEDVYNEKMLHYRDEHDKNAAKQELSEREKELYVPWPRILRAREKLRLAVSDFMEFQEYVIFCLYTLQPPLRLDFSPMRIVRDPLEKPEKGNCLLAEPGNYRFLLRDYKTAHKYGELVLDVPDVLEEVLAEWLELNQGEWLLCDQKGKPLSEVYLGATLREVMKKAVGRPMGVNMLRHSYISHQRRGEKSYLEQKDMAKRMAHSPAISVLYRKLDG